MNRHRSSPQGWSSRAAAALAPVTLALLEIAAATGCRKPSPPPAATAAAAADVVVTMPRAVRLPEYLEVTGRIDAELVVDIRSRVTGYLTKVAFRDGQFVAKGYPLYEIDDRPARAKLDEAAGAI